MRVPTRHAGLLALLTGFLLLAALPGCVAYTDEGYIAAGPAYVAPPVAYGAPRWYAPRAHAPRPHWRGHRPRHWR